MTNRRLRLIIFIVSCLTWLNPGGGAFAAELGRSLNNTNRASDTLNKIMDGIRSFSSDEIEVQSQVPDMSTEGDLSISARTRGGTFYNVHVLGEVQMPGNYVLLPSDRMYDAIKRAGGITNAGSQRSIQVRRDGETKYIDLYSYMFGGNLAHNPYLMENDVIFVPLKRVEVRIEGPVKRPGNYEITGPLSLKSVLAMAGGFTVGRSSKVAIRVIRFNEAEQREVIEVANLDKEIAGFKIKPGDTIVIPHVLVSKNNFDYELTRIPGDNLFFPSADDSVYVIGAVNMPGPYLFKPHYSYREYVSLAGAFKNSKVKQAKLIRRDGNRVRLSKNTVINPGDSIYVPERYWRAEAVASWLSTITSITLSTLAISTQLK